MSVNGGAESRPTSLAEVPNAYDYIVCGAGSSGSVVAARLCSLHGARVLLVEAGSRDDLGLVDDPNQWLKTLGTSLAWPFVAEPNPNLNDRAIPYTMGKGLGGGSRINVAAWARGHRSDWDSFASLTGDQRWGYEAISKLYRERIEDWTGASDPAHRGSGGKVFVQQVPQTSELTHALIAGSEEIGMPAFPNANGAMMEAECGVSLVDETVVGTRRRTVYESYVQRSPSCAKLTVLNDTTLLRVCFEGSRAVAVELEQRGSKRRIQATGEIILSCGAIQTPKILMHSGIGDESQLDRFGIGTVSHLPGVGRNLHDHVAFGCIWESRLPSVPNVPRSEFVGFWPTRPGLDAPNMYCYAGRNAFASQDILRRLTLPERAWSFILGMRPRSRGHIFLKSSDPEVTPGIDAGYLTDPMDLSDLKDGLEIARSISGSRALQSITVREVAPGPLSGASLDDFFRDSLITYWHQCGTAAMGRGPDSVVDSELRPHGLQNLRIADASVIPHVTVGNTMAPSIVIGERAAELIAG